MATAQPAAGVPPASDIRFRSARTRVLWISLVLGAFVLLAVPIHSAFIADPRALADERYVFAACTGLFLSPPNPSARRSSPANLPAWFSTHSS